MLQVSHQLDRNDLTQHRGPDASTHWRHRHTGWRCGLGCGKPMKNFSPWQQISIALAILATVFYFALQIPWVAALFG
jgi:hypothetical protein